MDILRSALQCLTQCFCKEDTVNQVKVSQQNAGLRRLSNRLVSLSREPNQTNAHICSSIRSTVVQRCDAPTAMTSSTSIPTHCPNETFRTLSVASCRTTQRKTATKSSTNFGFCTKYAFSINNNKNTATSSMWPPWIRIICSRRRSTIAWSSTRRKWRNSGAAYRIRPMRPAACCATCPIRSCCWPQHRSVPPICIWCGISPMTPARPSITFRSSIARIWWYPSTSGCPRICCASPLSCWRCCSVTSRIGGWRVFLWWLWPHRRRRQLLQRRRQRPQLRTVPT